MSRRQDGDVSVHPQPLGGRPGREVSQFLEKEGYVVEERLGQGGAGEVWRAVHTASGRSVAVKRLRVCQAAASPESASVRDWRFQTEVDAMALLDHPNVGRLLDSGFLPDGDPWLVMDLVDGPTLDRFVAEERLGLEEKLALFQKVCFGVTHAHQRGVLHRDLKPSNILVHSDGEPKVLDFGLARLLEPGLAGHTLTLDGLAIGTPGFMAPEQWAGRREAQDTRTDVYALGAVLLFLLSGEMPPCVRVPQDGAALEKAFGRLADEVPRDVLAVARKAMRWEPEERYASTSLLADDVGHCLRGEAILARKGQRLYEFRKWTRRHWQWVAAVGAIALSTAGGLGYAAVERRRVEQRRQQVLREAQDSLTLMLTDIDAKARAAGHPELATEVADRLAAIPWEWSGNATAKFEKRRFEALSARLHADLHLGERRVAKALPLYLEAAHTAESLAADFPQERSFRYEAALSRFGAGQCLGALKSQREAVDEFRLVVRWLRDLPDDSPRRLVAAAWREIGRLRLNLGDAALSAAAFDEASFVLEKLDPKDDAVRSLGARVQLDRAALLAGQDRSAEAMALAGSGLSFFEEQAALPDAPLSATIDRLSSLLAAADVAARCGDLDNAMVHHRRLREIAHGIPDYGARLWSIEIEQSTVQAALGLAGRLATAERLMEALTVLTDLVEDVESTRRRFQAPLRSAHLAAALQSRAALAEKAGLSAWAARDRFKAARHYSAIPAAADKSRVQYQLEAAECVLEALRLGHPSARREDWPAFVRQRLETATQGLPPEAPEQIRAAQLRARLEALQVKN